MNFASLPTYQHATIQMLFPTVVAISDCDKIKMDYEIVKDALRITGKKTDTAVEVASVVNP